MVRGDGLERGLSEEGGEGGKGGGTNLLGEEDALDVHPVLLELLDQIGDGFLGETVFDSQIRLDLGQVRLEVEHTLSEEPNQSNDPVKAEVSAQAHSDRSSSHPLPEVSPVR